MAECFFQISLRVNGEDVIERVEARKTLVDFLREDLGLTGTHVGCEQGVCGACTVLVDDDVVRGCLVLAVQCDGAKVTTIEGVSDSGEIADLQEAFRQRNALQCGFCTPGMLIDARELLSQLAPDGTVPSRDIIRQHISGNYCRCTGYQAIVDAIDSVAQARARKAGSHE
jgi:aerobic carbon-monoxide dehydrogenase small subunit